jgi:hypothetical protein
VLTVLVSFDRDALDVDAGRGSVTMTERRILHRPPEKRREMAYPRVDRGLRQPLLFHLDLPRFDVDRRDRGWMFISEAEEGEHGVRLVAPDVPAAQARATSGGVGPESDGVDECGVARLAWDQGRPFLPELGFPSLPLLLVFMGVDSRAFNDRRVRRRTAAPTKRATGLTNVALYSVTMSGSGSRSAAGTHVA